YGPLSCRGLPGVEAAGPGGFLPAQAVEPARGVHTVHPLLVLVELVELLGLVGGDDLLVLAAAGPLGGDTLGGPAGADLLGLRTAGPHDLEFAVELLVGDGALVGQALELLLVLPPVLRGPRLPVLDALVPDRGAVGEVKPAGCGDEPERDHVDVD